MKPLMAPVLDPREAAALFRELIGRLPAYLRHRLKCAGWRGDPIISGDVVRLVQAASLGVPRRINIVAEGIQANCLRFLEVDFSRNMNRIFCSRKFIVRLLVTRS